MNQKKARSHKLLRRMGFVAILLLALTAAVVTPVHADTILVMSIQSVAVMPGEAGAFDVLLTNPSTNSASVNIEAFNFEVDTTDTHVTFQGTTVNTATATYIFAGNSLFGPTLNLDSPGQAMDGSDDVATPNTFTTLNPGDTFGIGNVSFTVDPSAPIVSTAPVTFNLSNTSLANAAGGGVSFTTTDGTITIAPEPSGWLLCAVAFSALWFVVGRRKSPAAVNLPANR